MEIIFRKGRRSYTIEAVRYSEKEYFLSNETGEGIRLSEHELFDIFDTYFEQNF